MEYAIYPFKNMRISQNYNKGNHIPHWKNSKDYSDKPFDEAGKDGGQDVFAPLNDFKIIEIYGVDTSSTKGYTNSIILQSINKLHLPYGVDDYLFLTLTHINENDLIKLRKGMIIKAGQEILAIREGTDGLSTGNHFHITANIGKYYGFKKNSNGAWCYVYEKSLIPEEAFYVDKNHTKIYSTDGSKFKTLPNVPFWETFLPEKGYFVFGDIHENIGKVAEFMYKTFPAYTSKEALGDYFGKNLDKSIREFQRRTHLEINGLIDKKTLSQLVLFGFKC